MSTSSKSNMSCSFPTCFSCFPKPSPVKAPYPQNDCSLLQSCLHWSVTPGHPSHISIPPNQTYILHVHSRPRSFLLRPSLSMADSAFPALSSTLVSSCLYFGHEAGDLPERLSNTAYLSRAFIIDNSSFALKNEVKDIWPTPIAGSSWQCKLRNLVDFGGIYMALHGKA